MLVALTIAINAAAQINLIYNPGFENAVSTFTVPVGTPVVNHLMRVSGNAASVTDVSQPTATSVPVIDGLWVKRQTVSSSSLLAYLAPGGANGSATYLFLKIAGGNPTQGFDWTKMSAQQRVKLSNSTIYTFSFWAKSGNAVNMVYAYLADKSGDTGSPTFTKSIPLTGGTSWTKYSVTFDVPSEKILKPTLDFSTAYIGVGMNALYTSDTPPLTQNNWLYVDDFGLYATLESLVPTISSDTPENVFIKAFPIPVNITFNADVNGFSIDDLHLTNGSLDNFKAVNARTYTVDIFPASTGKVSLDIAAGAAVDAADNTRLSVMANQFVRFANREITTGDYSDFTTICPVKDNKKAIYTFTSDDGFTNAAVFFNSEFKRLDLKGSLALVANWINGAQTPASTYSFWNNLLADGRFDIINHSKSHVKFSTISNTQAGQDSLRAEITGNQAVFRTGFPDQDIITMANPAVVNTDAADVLIKQSHYAARNGSSGYNSLSPTDTEWMKLKMLANYFSSQSRAAYSSEINKYVDNIIANKQWLILLTHGIGTGANAMQDTAFTRHFEYVASRRADLWIAPLGDVTKYIRQKQNANIITLDSTDTRIAISLTHQLDANIFDEPLTLKTKVPAGWTNVKVTQGTSVKDIQATDENGQLYIYYDAFPNKGTISLNRLNSTGLRNSVYKNNEHYRLFWDAKSSELIFDNIDSGNYPIEVYNVNGMLCARFVACQSSNTFHFKNFSSGLYIIKVNDTKQPAVQKITVLLN